MTCIYKNDYMEIFTHNDSFIIRYNSGDIANTIREINVTKEDALRAQEGDEAAYWVLTHYENVVQFGEEEMNRRYAERGGRPTSGPIPR